MKSLPSGIGESTGDSLLTASGLHLTGDIWYVHHSGTDGAGLGKQRLAPLATLSQAVTNASDGDAIVFLAGCTLTMVATQTIAKKLLIASAGAGIGSMASLTRNIAGNGKLLDITTSRVELRNIYFPVSSQADTGAKVAFSGTDCRLKGCYFEAGAHDTGAQVALVTGADRFRDEGSTFISASTTTQPSSGLLISNALADVWLNGTIFDGGTKGWSSGYGLDGTAAAQTRFLAEAISLLRDSDVGLHASSTGFVQVGSSSGSARVVHA
jgi:hypothetical protein